MKRSARPGVLARNADDQILNKRIVWLSSRLAMLFQRDVLDDSDLTVQEWRVLVKLAQTGESHLRALARESSVSAGHVSRMLAILVRKGLVSTADSLTDKRKTIYTLTAEGKSRVLACWPDALSLNDDVRSPFTDREFEQFITYLDRAIEHVESRLNETGSVT